MIGLHWPWAFLALPLPWLAAHWLPYAPSAPRAALWLPFFHELAGLQSVSRPVSRRMYAWALGTWCGLILALARPTWDDTECFRWPLAAALISTCLLAHRLTRPPRHYRSLPSALPGSRPGKGS